MLILGKQATHVLTPHGPEMWMHVMEARNTLEDLPAISEGVGGRITDYRITDFAEFIKSNILIPYPAKSENLPKPKYEKDGGSFVRRRSNSVEDIKKPVDLAKARLLRRTTYWPLTLGGSVLFALSAVSASHFYTYYKSREPFFILFIYCFAAYRQTTFIST